MIETAFRSHRQIQRAKGRPHTKARNVALENTSAPSARESGCPATHGQTWDKSVLNVTLTCIRTSRYLSSVFFNPLSILNPVFYSAHWRNLMV